MTRRVRQIEDPASYRLAPPQVAEGWESPIGMLRYIAGLMVDLLVDIGTGKIRITRFGFHSCRFSVASVGEVEGGPLESARAALEIAHSPWRYLPLRNAVVLDVGALIGDSALLFVAMGAQRVYAYEPSRRYFDLARRNLFLKDNVVLRNLAVGGTLRRAKLSGFLMGKHLSVDGMEEVDVLSARDVIESIVRTEGRIDLIKLDCEGSEHEIIENLTKSDLGHVSSICLEMHGSASDRARLTSRIVSLGFKQTRSGSYFTRSS